MSACHLDTKQVTPPCFEMFPLTSPQIKFSGGGGGGCYSSKLKVCYRNVITISSEVLVLSFMGMEFFFERGGGVIDPYKMTLIVNR